MSKFSNTHPEKWHARLLMDWDWVVLVNVALRVAVEEDCWPDVELSRVRPLSFLS